MSDGQETRQKVLGGIAFVAILAAAVIFWKSVQDSDPVRRSKVRNYICAKTGKAFDHTVEIGEIVPVYSPHSGANTGYHAELCYWTRDGDGGWKAKLDPTPVLLNSIFEPDADTVCPDCGHEVVGHNPRPPKDMMDTADPAADG